MSRHTFRPAALACLLLAAAAPAWAGDYVSTEGASLTFASSYEGEAFQGHFRQFQARIGFDPAAPEACRFEVEIDLASADTGLPERDGMLLEADFFDVGRHAKAYYRAERCRATSDDRFIAEGRLSLRGVEQAVALTFSWQAGESPVLEGQAGLDRLAFGVGVGDWADTDMIPAEVTVSTRVPLRPVGN